MKKKHCLHNLDGTNVYCCFCNTSFIEYKKGRDPRHGQFYPLDSVLFRNDQCNEICPERNKKKGVNDILDKF